MKIETMSKDHLSEVTRLAAQLGYPNSENDIAERFAEIEMLSGYALFIAKSDDDEVMGWIQINEEPATLLVGRRADVGALVVDEKYRSAGVGKALLARAEQWAKDQNFSLIRVKSNTKREGAHKFYLREGFNLSKTSHMFTKNL